MRGGLFAVMFAVLPLANHASAAPPQPPPGKVTFETPAQGAELIVLAPGDLSGRTCWSGCTLDVRPGPYAAYLTADGRTAAFAVRIHESSTVEVLPLDRSQRSIGFGFIITGGVLITGGLFAFGYDFAHAFAATPSGFEGDSGRGNGGYHPAGWVRPMEVMGGLGLAATLIGVGLVVAARPRVVVHSWREEPPSTEDRDEIMFAPAVLPGGGGLLLGGRL